MQLPIIKGLLIAAIGLFFSNQTEAALQSKKLSSRVSAKDYERLKQIPSEEEILNLEDRLTALINQVRIEHGLSELGAKEDLAELARNHSRNMAAGRCNFGHDGFQDRWNQILKLGSYRSAGENVAYSYLVEDHLLVALDGWMKSSGHRDNILGDFNTTGIGIAFSQEGRCYITQLFAKSSKR